MAQPRHDSFLAICNREEEDIRATNAIQNAPDLQEGDREPEGFIFTFLRENDFFLRATNFNEEEVRQLYQLLLPEEAANRRRGPRPKSSLMDSLLCYLWWAHTGLDYGSLATVFHLKEGRFEDNINRVRPMLLSALRKRWIEPRPRPQPLMDTAYPFVGLLVDSTTVHTFMPKKPFDEAKIYFDGKNGIYGLKKEVGVMAHSPHYALFFTPKQVGSMHDYTIHKNHFAQYLEYLEKEPDESVVLATDHASSSWAALMDKGYVGPPSDTPGLRRIAIQRGRLPPAASVEREALKRIRVPIERWFGRQQSLWHIIRGPYRWDHTHLDTDFEVCGLLTNEHIRRLDLQEQDREFYKRLVHRRFLTAQAKAEKRKAQLKACTERKRARLYPETVGRQ